MFGVLSTPNKNTVRDFNILMAIYSKECNCIYEMCMYIYGRYNFTDNTEIPNGKNPWIMWGFFEL